MIRTNVPEFVDTETGLYPPLGLLYVASFAIYNTDYQVEILDTHAEGLTYQQIEERIRKIQPDIVGIQTFTFTLIDVILTAKIVKKVSSEILICLGGPHVNIYPEETINIPEVDFVILGEGEFAFAELLDALYKKGDLSNIKGLLFKRDSKIIKTASRGYIEDLNILPFPNRRLIPYKRYYSLIAKHTPITTMMSSRGCPFRCLFCERPHLGKSFRARSSINVVDEMEEAIGLGIKEFFFYDDTFTVDKRRVIEICNEILKRGLKISWDIRTRIDTVDIDLLKRLKEAGCERIHYGVEAGTERILKILRKEIDLKKAKEIFKITKELGITTLAYFMIGSPSETKEEILRTIDFALKLNPDFVHFSITTPFPGTGLYRLGLESRVLEYDYWKEFSENPETDFTPQVWEENLTKNELLDLLNLAYRRFYIRPQYIIRELMKIKSLSEFRKKLKAGLKVIGAY